MCGLNVLTPFEATVLSYRLYLIFSIFKYIGENAILWINLIYEYVVVFLIVLQWYLLSGGGVKKSDHCSSWRVSWAWQEQPASQISIALFYSWVVVRLLSSWASHVNQSQKACQCTILWMSFYHCEIIWSIITSWLSNKKVNINFSGLYDNFFLFIFLSQLNVLFWEGHSQGFDFIFESLYLS